MEKSHYFKVVTPLSPQRALPEDSSEMVNQLLLGEPLLLLDRKQDWIKVQSLIDQYEGWVDGKMLNVLDVDISKYLESIHRSSELLTKLPRGGFVPYGHFAQAKEKPKNTLIEDAHSFIGAPYLWGGKSVMGIDCSGFTQVVLGVHGMELPRDASDQCELGETISFTEEAKTGDLAFFDNQEGKIIHVGIIVQEEETMIIHASGLVRKDRLDHQGIYAADRGEYSHQLRLIKRITSENQEA